MTIKEFPPIETANEYGLLAVGGDLEIASILLAYRSGIFPWPIDGILAWFAPPKRALLYFDDLHVSRSLTKFLKKETLEFKFNHDFAAVINLCSDVPRGGKGTWITDEIIDAYIDLHKAGYALSFEAYYQGALVGGLYGVKIGNYFAAESMFHLKDNASKAVLVYTCVSLKKHGLEWLDCQVLNPFLKTMGAKEFSRSRFMRLLPQAMNPSS